MANFDTMLDDYSQAQGCGLPPIVPALIPFDKRGNDRRRDEFEAKKKKYKECQDARKASGDQTKAGKILNKALKYNPATAIVRNGVIAAARINMFGMAVRLYPAFITEQEAKAKGIKLSAIPKAKKAWDKVSNFFKKGMGGNPENLKSAIISGHDKPVFKRAKRSGFDGTDEFYNVSGMEVAVAAMPAIAATIGMINNAGADKNPYEGSSNRSNVDTSNDDQELISEQDQSTLRDIEENDASESDKLFGMPKTAVYIGGGILAALAVTGIIIAVVRR
jgi:hypothetical protein